MIRAVKGRKESAVAAAEATSARGQVRASRLYACCFTEGGDENCTRKFMQSAWLKNHLKRGVHSGGMWRPWGGSAKQAQPKSNMQQRLPGSLAATLAASVEAGAVVGISPDRWSTGEARW